ncbi:MAG: FAD-binding oxidoreductase [Planctomycetota bacterium]|nr:FAD-binding oxidoreductase [Planctomycetota bacterium]
MSALDTLGQRLERLAGEVELARPRFDVEPLPLVAPPTVEAAVELVKLAAADKLRVIPLGLGSKLGWCGTPGHADFVLSTRRLERVVSHVPDDGTITVEAGLSMARLAAKCRSGGHFLTPDVPAPARRTIGGVVAAGESGLDRLRYGPVRHHVLGTRTLLADGSLARSGGQLVKNVTGFDLHRLYCGSHGTLGVIVEVSLRLHPEPEREAWLTVEASSLADALQLTCAWPGARTIDGLAAREEAERASVRQRFDGSPHPKLHVACLPSKLENAAKIVLEALANARIEHGVALQPGIAEMLVELRSNVGDAQALSRLAGVLRNALARDNVSLAMRDAPRGALVELDPFGAPPAGLELMRTIQRNLDPDGVFSTGRFAGGL